MSEVTINQVLVLQKAVRERANELRTLRQSVSTREIHHYGGEDRKTTEPQYDVKALDKKVTELEKFLFKTDMAIKQSNATVKITVDFDEEKLFEPLQ